jgi:hypothetical protein
VPSPPAVFTIEAVNALLPRLSTLVGEQMQRRAEIEARLEELGARSTESGTFVTSDDDPPPLRAAKQDLAERMDRYRRGWSEVEAMGAVLKDPRMGLLDFYGHVDGKLVWLCWKYGETSVGHYHALNEGFSGRKPILPTVRDRHLN